MIDEERLKGAKKHLKGALTRFLLDGGTDIKVVDRLISDVNLLLEYIKVLEELNIKYRKFKNQDNLKTLANFSEEIRRLEQQNKRYREVIQESNVIFAEAIESFDEDEEVNGLEYGIKITSKALEEYQ